MGDDNKEVVSGVVGREERVLTYGEKLVGVTFNPSGIPEVDEIKELYARVIDFCYKNNNDPEGGMKGELMKEAIMDAMKAAMTAVKGITYKY